MTDAGYFRGTNIEQDKRFSDKDRKLMKQMKFSENLNHKIDMKKIELNVLKPWITKRITEMLGIDDDVVTEFIFNQLEESVSSHYLFVFRPSEQTSLLFLY